MNLPGLTMMFSLGVLTMLEWFLGILCWPIIAIFDWSMLGIYCYYGPIQIIALLMAYFLRKKGIITYGSPLMYYVVAFIIGHIMYSVIYYWLFINFATFF